MIKQVSGSTIQSLHITNCRAGVFITFAEALDLCLRSSLPLLLLAMSFLALSIANSPDESRAASVGLLNWHGNSTTSVLDFTTNDALLGSQDPFFWFLIPLFGFVSAGVCVILNYAALLILHILCSIYSLLSARPAWIRKNDQRKIGPAFSTASPRRRLLTTVFLLFLVSTLIPYQFAYMVACIVQIATCTRALRVAKENVG
jgi:glycosylphosphatidylinositol deacylase